MKKRSDGRWQKSITLDGNKVYFYSRAKTEKGAERDITKQIVDYKRIIKRGLLFRDVADSFESEYYQNLSYNTIRQYKRSVSDAVEAFGKRPIRDISAQEIQDYVNEFSAQRYTKKTISAKLSALNLIFTYAIVHNHIKSNPCQYVRILDGAPSSKREALTDEETQIVIQNKNAFFGLFAFTLLFTGLRECEALALTSDDIDNHSITVSKTLYYQGNKPYIKEPKTKAGIRSIALPDILYNEIAQIKGVIFPNVKGEYLSKSNFQRFWERYKKETGLDVTPHQFRHTYATILFDAGIDEVSAKNLMGHSDIAITKNIYTHISQARKANVAFKLNTFAKSMGVN